MKVLGGELEGVSLPIWINWLSVAISADMAYNREMNALRDGKHRVMQPCDTERC